MFAVRSAGFADSAAALAGVVEASRLANAATARMVLAAAEAQALLVAEDLDRLPARHEQWAGAGARSDIATALGTSGAAAQQLIDVGTVLRDRLPHTTAWFTAGVLDLAKVKVIVEELGPVAPAVIDAIEPACVAAARFKGPRALRAESSA